MSRTNKAERRSRRKKAFSVLLELADKKPDFPPSRPAKAVATTSSTEDSSGWNLCFLSLLGLSLNQVFGMLAAILFIVPWLFIIMPRHVQFTKAIASSWPLLLLPGFAALSTLWSRDPLWSLRTATEYAATILIGIAAGSCVKRSTLLTALLAALTIVTTASMFYALYQGQFSQILAHKGVSGFYGSKNQFAGAASIQVIIAACLLFFGKNSLIRRLGYTFFIFSGIGFVYVAHSGGAFVSLLISFAVVGGLYMFNRNRLLTVAIVILATLLGGAILSEVDIDELSSTALSGLGKDKTLTGRTDLWQVALNQIDERPEVGDGYQAFWRPGNLRAEQLWVEFDIPQKAGFHFHDTYLQTAVDLGLVGAAILVALLVQALIRAAKRGLDTSDSIDLAVAGIMFFFILWSIVEVEFINPFLLSGVILCLCTTRKIDPVDFLATSVRPSPVASPLLSPGSRLGRIKSFV